MGSSTLVQARHTSARVQRPRQAEELSPELLRVWQEPIDYRPNSCFDDKSLKREILSPLPTTEPIPKKRRIVAPPADGFSQDLTILCETPLLSKSQEVHLFRKMNYLKHCAATIQGTTAKATTVAATKVRDMLLESQTVRDEIVKANTRLVISIARKFVDTHNSFAELFSEGMVSLMHAVEKYDYARGNAFSTYATSAIRNNLVHLLKKTKLENTRFRNTDDTVLASLPDDSSISPPDPKPNRLQSTLTDLMRKLERQERFVLMARHGLDDDRRAKTLREVASELGVSRERVRQIQLAATLKLQRIASESYLPVLDRPGT